VYDAAREWIRNDPATGKAWVQRSNLADKQKEKLLK
jgi:ABC-type proline/glycine betaine transport system substrate-binding protein